MWFVIRYLLIQRGRVFVVEIASRRSALASVYQTGPFGIEASPAGVTLVERTGLSIVIAECAEDNADNTAALAKTLNADISFAGKSTEANDRRIIWLAPGRWVIVGKDKTYGETAAMLASSAETIAVNDVSSSKTVIRVSGPNVRDTLAASCTIDLHPSVFIPGMSATTDLDHVVVTMDCLDADTFDLYVSRAYAVSFWEWLIEASEEYGGEIKATI